MDNPNLAKILNMPSDQIDRSPKPLPQGWYIACVDGQPEEGQSQSGTVYYDFPMRIVDTFEDVDDDEMEEYLTKLDGSIATLSEVRIDNRMFMTERAVGRLVSFLDHLEGVKPADVKKEKTSIGQRMARVNGKTCVIHVRHEPWQNGGGVSPRIDRTMIYDKD
jgi:hypothetical protein